MTQESAAARGAAPAVPKVDKDPRRRVIAQCDAAHEKGHVPVVAIRIGHAGLRHQCFERVAQQVATGRNRKLGDTLEILGVPQDSGPPGPPSARGTGATTGTLTGSSIRRSSTRSWRPA